MVMMLSLKYRMLLKDLLARDSIHTSLTQFQSHGLELLKKEISIMVKYKMKDHEKHMKKFRQVLEVNYDLIKKKNMKYGERWRDFGVIGMLIEVLKKAGRLKNMTMQDEGEFVPPSIILESIEEEGSIYDTIQDMANYCMFLQILFIEHNPRIARESIKSTDRVGGTGDEQNSNGDQ